MVLHLVFLFISKVSLAVGITRNLDLVTATDCIALNQSIELLAAADGTGHACHMDMETPRLNLLIPARCLTFRLSGSLRLAVPGPE